MPQRFADSVLAATRPGAGVLDFLALTLCVVLVLLVVLAATAIFFTVMNARHPENRIQKNRTNKRVLQELAYAPGSIAVIALCYAGGLFCQFQGIALTPLPITWWSIPLMLGISIVLYDAWFYWVHRLLHTKAMYRFHALHHRSVAPTIWTNHHETIVEALCNQLFYLLIVFVIPIPWPALVLQKIYDQASGMLGHAGYEHFASAGARAPFPLACTVFHDQHHSSFRYNFAHSFSLWDRWFGTLNPKYDATVEAFEKH